MEFVSNKDTLVILPDGIVSLNRANFTVKVINMLDFDVNMRGDIETEKYRIKFSKGLLYLFDKQEGIISQVFTFSKRLSIEDLNKDITPINDTNTIIPKTDTVLQTFVVFPGFYIKLYSDYSYIDIIDNGNSSTETIVNKVDIGSDTNFTTNIGNILTISSKRNNKWNGIPIGTI